MDGVPQFINAMEAAQSKLKRAKLVINDEYLHAVALKSLLQPGEYETETWEWLKLPEANQTWDNWKTTFRAAYVAKRRSKAVREGEQKPFGGSAQFGPAPVGNKPEKTDSNPPTMSHQMLDSLEGYLDNIAAAATQTAATGTPLAELAASLAVSVDTVARKQIEIKRLTEHIKALRKKGVSITTSVPNTGDNNATTCKHCKAVGCSVPHRNNHCFFDPRKNKKRVDWAAKLMKEKGIVFNDA